MRPFIVTDVRSFSMSENIIKEGIYMSTEIMSEKFANEAGADLIDVSHMAEYGFDIFVVSGFVVRK